MDRLRWGACLLSVGAMFAFTGCARTFGRWMSPSEYDEYCLQKEMNDKQSSMITALTFDKEHLAAENSALRTEVGDKGALIDATKRIMDGMQAQLDQFNKTAPPGEEESITSFMTPYGEVGPPHEGRRAVRLGRGEVETGRREGPQAGGRAGARQAEQARGLRLHRFGPDQTHQVDFQLRPFRRARARRAGLPRKRGNQGGPDALLRVRPVCSDRRCRRQGETRRSRAARRSSC